MPDVNIPIGALEIGGEVHSSVQQLQTGLSALASRSIDPEVRARSSKAELLMRVVLTVLTTPTEQLPTKASYIATNLRNSVWQAEIEVRSRV